MTETTASKYHFDWADLAFGSKKVLSSKRAVFIAAPRDISTKRFTQLIKEYLPTSSIILGLAKEPYIDGFDGQEHFKSLNLITVEKIINKVNTSASTHKIYSLHYNQRDTKHIIAKIGCRKAVLIRGSWLHTFHTRDVYYNLVSNNIAFELISPFADENEAVEYANKHVAMLARKTKNALSTKTTFSEGELFEMVQSVASASFDYSFQTGAVLAKKQAKNYRVLVTAHNKVVPYETYAMHFGAQREENFSPPSDLNHYDTCHAEVMLLLHTAKSNVTLKGTSLFINLMPCPPCTRMICETDIAEIVYTHDHSDGYALKMLTAAGKNVRRAVV